MREYQCPQLELVLLLARVPRGPTPANSTLQTPCIQIVKTHYPPHTICVARKQSTRMTVQMCLSRVRHSHILLFTRDSSQCISLSTSHNKNAVCLQTSASASQQTSITVTHLSCHNTSGLTSSKNCDSREKKTGRIFLLLDILYLRKCYARALRERLMWNTNLKRSTQQPFSAILSANGQKIKCTQRLALLVRIKHTSILKHVHMPQILWIVQL